jgi:hypothetical protein
MPHLRWILPAFLLVATISGATVQAASGLERPGVVRITNSELTRVPVDVGTPGRSPGDLLVMTHLLYNKRITQRALGHEEAICTFLGRGGVLGSGTRNCQLQFYLPEGRILASGNVHNMLLFTIPVVGGTGIYENVGGTLTVTYLGNGPVRQLLLFRLTV